jgi:hypothetical protein
MMFRGEDREEYPGNSTACHILAGGSKSTMSRC